MSGEVKGIGQIRLTEIIIGPSPPNIDTRQFRYLTTGTADPRIALYLLLAKVAFVSM